MECRLLRASDPRPYRHHCTEDTAVNITFVWGGTQGPQSGFLNGEEGAAAGQEVAGVNVKVLLLSQNKVLRRFAEQILDDKVVDRAQRFVEQDLKAPCVVLEQAWRGSGGAVLRRGQVARAVLAWKPRHHFYELLFWQTFCPLFATVHGRFWQHFFCFSM